jgi:hypothetical protein
VGTDDVQGLAARLDLLERENAALRSARSGRGRAAAAVALVLVGVLLAPLAVVAGWARVSLQDTDRFVATYGALIDDPAVQAYLTDQVMTVIDQTVGVDQLTTDLVDGVVGLGTGPRATAALQALQGPLTQAVEQLIRTRTAAFIDSDAFASVWREALRATHTQLVATLSGSPEAVVGAGADGTVSIQLGPIVAAVRDRLVAQGLTVAARIPDVHRQLPITTSAAVPRVMVGYQVAVIAGTWLPLVALVLVAAGVLVARRRRRALVVAALALAAVAALLLAGLALGRVAVLTQTAADVPATVVAVGYGTATRAMVGTTQAVLVLSLVLALTAWLAGPAAGARWTRELYGAGTGSAGRAAASRGVLAGATGRWLGRHAGALRVLVAVAAALVIVLVRPLTVALVLGTAALALLVLVLLDLVVQVDRATPTTPAAAGVVGPEPDLAD